MTRVRLLLCTLATAVASAVSGADHHGRPPAHLAPCEPGYQWVQEVEYRQVESLVCKIVPDVIKHTKVIYTTKDDPFCIHRSGRHCLSGKCDEGCPHCEGPYCRKQLVKKIVTCEEPTTKCVTERVVNTVPCMVWKKVPCGTVVTPIAPQAAVTSASPGAGAVPAVATPSTVPAATQTPAPLAIVSPAP